MISYLDRMFCPFYIDCWHGGECRCALTPKVRKDAEVWWNGPEAPIAEYTEKPKCFMEKVNEEN